jgi:hypothetical protein
MSGIYLIVWDESKKDKTKVLRPTKVGWPHITLAYTGKELPEDELIKISSDVFSEWALKKITLSCAYVNSFEDRAGHTRHDVLIHVLEKEQVEEARLVHLITPYANSEKFSMNSPHVTYGIYETLEEAKIQATVLNENYLPYMVKINGVSID